MHERLPATEEERAGAAKYDLGPDLVEAAGEPLPWGYGRDLITLMVVDPQRLFLYWEVTDEAIARARARLSAAEDGLCVRVYDVTGRMFDGTNAHRHVDVPVSRTERQRFVAIPSPGSEQCAEIGVRGRDGAFARIARSRTAELPRQTPRPASEPVAQITVTALDGPTPRLQIVPAPSAGAKGSASDDRLAPGPEAGGQPTPGHRGESGTQRPAAPPQAPAPAVLGRTVGGASEQSAAPRGGRDSAPWRGSGQA